MVKKWENAVYQCVDKQEFEQSRVVLVVGLSALLLGLIGLLHWSGVINLKAILCDEEESSRFEKVKAELPRNRGMFVTV